VRDGRSGAVYEGSWRGGRAHGEGTWTVHVALGWRAPPSPVRRARGPARSAGGSDAGTKPTAEVALEITAEGEAAVGTFGAGDTVALAEGHAGIEAQAEAEAQAGVGGAVVAAEAEASGGAVFLRRCEVREGRWHYGRPLDGSWRVTWTDRPADDRAASTVCSALTALTVGKFAGGLVGGRPHSDGVCKYPSGAVYSGTWDSGASGWLLRRRTREAPILALDSFFRCLIAACHVWTHAYRYYDTSRTSPSHLRASPSPSPTLL
jgi:hypothetical protein